MSEVLEAVLGMATGLYIAGLLVRLWVTLGKVSRWIDSQTEVER